MTKSYLKYEMKLYSDTGL